MEIKATNFVYHKVVNLNILTLTLHQLRILLNSLLQKKTIALHEFCMIPDHCKKPNRHLIVPSKTSFWAANLTMESGIISPTVLERFLFFLEEINEVYWGKMRSKVNVPQCKFRHGDHLFRGNMISCGKN